MNFPARITPSSAWKLLNTYGFRWVFARALYSLRLRLGLIALRLPAKDWESGTLSSWLVSGVPAEPNKYVFWRRKHRGQFFFSELPVLDRGEFQLESAIADSNALLHGKWRFFSHRVFDLGFPPNWHENPLTGERAPEDIHWTTLSEANTGDIKLIWETSRFAICYILARAYAATSDERFPGAFWALVEDWARHNPPNLGANWGCGQEATFRVMAWCFALYAFEASPHTTPERVASLSAMLAEHGRRIESNIGYALSQNNNHGISEAAGLWTLGLLFPEFRDATRWRERGKELVERQVRCQIFDDGGYVQHSVNYHRLVLHDLLWALRLGELNGQRFSDAAYDRFARATNFLAALVDPASGGAPNIGSNDGALLLPLNGCDFSDFRPVIQASQFLVDATRRYPAGPWDEDLIWLFSPEAAAQAASDASPKSSDVSPQSGFYVLRGDNSWAVLHNPDYKSRPAQLDQMHLDVWWKGVNVALDPGTYLYSAPSPWNNALAYADVHNTLTVDGSDQASRVGRFLWLDWPHGKTRYTQSDAYEGDHDGYSSKGIIHHRAVKAIGDCWIVVDDIHGTGSHTNRLQWLFPDVHYDFSREICRLVLHTSAGDMQCQIQCSSPAVASLARAGIVLIPDTDSCSPTRGWLSKYYADKQPALSLAAEAVSVLPSRFVTVLMPMETELRSISASQAVLGTKNGDADIVLSPIGAIPVIRSVKVHAPGSR